MIGASKAAVLKLLVEVEKFCSVYRDVVLRKLDCKRVEADEIWSFVGAKAKNATSSEQGDIWTYTALCANSKLVLSWLVGARNHANTYAFMEEHVASRLASRVQLTTDGLKWYLTAIENAFGWNGADFAPIIKQYGMPTDEAPGRYSPAECSGVEKARVFGNPDMDLVSTSYVERQNLTMRRFTRLTNRFSKKVENDVHALSLHFMHYNFCRPHQPLTKENKGIKTNPAMAADVTDHVWTLEEILGKMMDSFLLR